MIFLTKEQVEVMNITEVNRHLRQLSQTYKLDQPIQEYFTEELWNQVDDIANTLLYLEDRLQWLEQYKHLHPAQ
jgi:hypothetical protein